MKRIAVCIKQVVSLGEHPLFTPEGRLRRDTVRYSVNEADLHAVEEAARLSRDGRKDVLVLTLGPGRADRALRECLARGVFSACRIDSSEETAQDPAFVARLLADRLRGFAPDLILCGESASDDGFSQVGGRIAEHLGFCCVSGVVALEEMEGGREVRVHRRLLRGNREVLSAPFPAVIGVHPSIHSLRHVGIPAVARAARTEIEVAPAPSEETVCGSGPSLRRVGVVLPRKRPKRVFIPDASLDSSARLDQLISGGAKKRKSPQKDLVEGPPEKAAQAIYEFLQLEGFVGPTDDPS